MLKWIVIVLQALLSAAALAAEPPTNKQLIAAMTPTTESVIIWRIEPLMSDKSVLKAHAGKLSWTWLTPGKDDQLVGCISEALTKATIRVQVLAGSKFQPVKGIGAGEHELRQIMYTKDSLEEVRKKLDNKDGVKDLGKNLALNGITVYTSDIVLPWDKLAASKMADEKDPKAKPKTTPVFAAFPDDHCVVITFSQTEMDLLLKGLKAPSDKVPERWQDASKGLDLEAAVVLLRSYNKDTNDLFSPLCKVLPEEMRGGITSLAAVVTDVATLKVDLRARSSNMEKDVAWYRKILFRDGLTAEAEDGGWKGTIDSSKSSDYPTIVFLQLIGLFGINFAI